MKNVLTLISWLCLFLSSCSLHAQSLELNQPREVRILATSVAMATGGLLINWTVKPLSVNQIMELNEANVPSFDRWSIGKSSATWKHASDLGVGVAGMGMLVLSIQQKEIPFSNVVLVMSEAVMLDFSVNYLAKGIFLRPRPYVYDAGISMERKLKKDARFSFFSMHTSLSATACFTFYSLMHNQLSGNQKPLFLAAAAGIPLVVGWGRIKSGEHFTSDVVAGYLAGLCTAHLLSRWHRKDANHSSGIEFYPTGKGIYLSLKF